MATVIRTRNPARELNFLKPLKMNKSLHRKLLALLSRAGFDDDMRHELVYYWTDGRTQSTKDLSEIELYRLVNRIESDFNFEKIYGVLGKYYIHVHHLVPLCEIGEEYNINPKADLIPVCPNCHAMLHRSGDPNDLESLKKMVKK